MSKARDLADFVAAGGQLADGVINVAEIGDLTATAAELNTLDGITATVTELNTLDGATSSIQDQLDNISVTSGSLTKSFASGEIASITLSSAISPAPVVSVTKEVAQVGVSSKGAWDVATDGANYELHDTAYATTLTPGTVFDLANASYNSVSFSVNSQDSAPRGIKFNSDGTKLYMIGTANNRVYQYALSTAYDISTASAITGSFYAGSQDTRCYDLALNNDGTKMYILGDTNNRIFSYTLSTAYDTNTASYDSVSFSVGGEEAEPSGFVFNNDGTKLFVIGSSGDEVNEYSLSTAYDISTLSFTTNFSVASQDVTPSGIAFNANGTKMFIVGSVGDSVYEYSLSTGFDVSTASYSSVSFNVASEENAPQSIIFNSDYTKMYIVGITNDTVYQYSTVKDALILGSGSFASTDVGKRIVGNGGEAILTAADGSYSVVTAFTDSSVIASGSWSMFALTFDGTDGVTVNQLVEGDDLANATYTSKSFTYSTQTPSSESFDITKNGTKLYIVDFTNDRLDEYDLSTAYDITTASYVATAVVPSIPTGIRFKPDGTSFYIKDNNTNRVYQYDMSTPYDVTTAATTKSLDISSQGGNSEGIFLKSDGTKFYQVSNTTDTVYQYTLSTAWNISTATYDSVSFSIASQITDVREIAFNSTGTKMYATGPTSDIVYRYSLSTAWDISTLSYDSVSFSVASQSTNPRGLVVADNDTKLYVLESSSHVIYQYDMGNLYTPTSQYLPTVTKTTGQIDTAFWTDINTMTADETLNGGQVYYAVSTDDRTTWAVIDDTDGVRNIVRDNAGTWQYNDATTYSGTTWVNATTNNELYALQEALSDGIGEGSIGYSLASASYDSVSLDTSSEDAGPGGIFFKPDGTKMFIVGFYNDAVKEYSLSTAWDLSTASYDSVSFSVSSQETSPLALFFKDDGTKMYVMGNIGDDVNEYDLSTAWDVSSATYSQNFSVSAKETNPQGLFFKPDGTSMYVGGHDSDKVHQYTLSTAWDVSTASFTRTLDPSANVTGGGITGIQFNPTGTSLYILSNIDDEVNEYTLTTAYDISTATYTRAFSVLSQATNPTDIFFKDDGTKFYITDTTTSYVFQYSSAGVYPHNRMDKTQLDAVTDPNHYTLGDTLDLAIMLYTDSAGSIPTSDGVTINYDAEALNQGAVVGTDYDFDFPNSTTVRVTSNAAQNLKIRVV